MPFKVRHPVLCNYYVTYRCNARCSFCDIWEKPSPYVTPEQATANLRDLKRLGVRVVDFTGGEPLLHPQLDLLLAEAKRLGFITTVTTNGLLYPKRGARLRGLVDMLHVSIDWANAQAHDEGRGVPCFDHALHSLDLALSWGQRPDVLMTVTDANLHDVEAVYRTIARPRGLLLILNPIFAYPGVEVGGLNPRHHPTLRAWARRPGVYLNTAFLDLREAGGNRTANPTCNAGTSTVVIGPDDTLILPCYHLGLSQRPIQGRLYELWHQTAVANDRAQAGRLPGCEGCTINCYMQPSMATQGGRYFWRALPSTLKYSLEKWVYA